MARKPKPRICARCKRPLGYLPSGLVRAWEPEISNRGVSSVCQHQGSCKLAKMDAKDARERQRGSRG